MPNNPADLHARTSIPRPEAGDQDVANSRRWWALACLCLSLVLITLDNTVLNVALPTLSRDLHASTSQLQWIVDSYQLVFAGLLFSAGSLADRYGRKGMLAAGLVVFGLGTVASSFAGDAVTLIGTRAFMGIGGAMIMPSTLSILGTVFPDAAERAKAIAIWAAMSAVGIALGPVIGGLLLAHFGWGSIFMVNVPVVVLALVGGHALLPTSKDPSPGRMDLLGSLLSILALGGLVFAVIEGPDAGWASLEVLASAAVGAAAVGAFVAWERFCDHPMLDLDLFRRRGFSVGSLTLMLGYFGALGTYFLYTQHLQFVLGYSALRAGVYSVPFAVALVVFSLQTPGLIRRVGTARVAGAGLTVLAVGVAVRAFATASTGFPLLLVSLVVCGIGVGLTVAPSTGAIMSSLPPSHAGVGSAINDAARQVGAATGVAVLGSVWSSAYRGGLTRATVGAAVPDRTLLQSRASIGTVAQSAHALPRAAGDQLLAAARTAFVHGSNVANVAGAVVVLVAAALAFRYMPQGGRRAAVVPVEADVDGDLEIDGDLWVRAEAASA
jgi:EmrB/QacA subfamily drug resistance transporter